MYTRVYMYIYILYIDTFDSLKSNHSDIEIPHINYRIFSGKNGFQRLPVEMKVLMTTF